MSFKKKLIENHLVLTRISCNIFITECADNARWRCNKNMLITCTHFDLLYQI